MTAANPEDEFYVPPDEVEKNKKNGSSIEIKSYDEVKTEEGDKNAMAYIGGVCYQHEFEPIAEIISELRSGQLSETNRVRLLTFLAGKAYPDLKAVNIMTDNRGNDLITRAIGEMSHKSTEFQLKGKPRKKSTIEDIIDDITE